LIPPNINKAHNENPLPTGSRISVGHLNAI